MGKKFLADYHFYEILNNIWFITHQKYYTKQSSVRKKAKISLIEALFSPCVRWYCATLFSICIMLSVLKQLSIAHSYPNYPKYNFTSFENISWYVGITCEEPKGRFCNVIYPYEQSK